MSANRDKSALTCLLNEELSAITFVRDYLQLHFDGPFFNVYIWPKIKIGDRILELETPGYRDALCAQIGKTVIGFCEKLGARILINFSDGVVIEMSIGQGGRIGPEALLFRDAAGQLSVW